MNVPPQKPLSPALQTAGAPVVPPTDAQPTKPQPLTHLALRTKLFEKRKPGKPGRGLAPKKFGPLVEGNLYPEPGTYPDTGDDSESIFPLRDERNVAREVVHGRWAMLGVTGAWAAENATGVPWFKAAEFCTPDDCSKMNDTFPALFGQIKLAPEGSGYPSFWYVVIIETALMGAAEGYRTGLFDNPFPELNPENGSNPYPGQRFDPLNLSESGNLEELKVKELKHGRLAMLAWLGLICQEFVTGKGPIQNWAEHVADPVHQNIATQAFWH